MASAIHSLLQRRSATLLGLTATLLLAGCTTPLTPPPPAETTKYTLENTDRFALVEGATQHAISCTGLMELPLADGRLEVVANLKNRETQPLKVEASCAFKNAADVTTEETPWQAVTLPDNATVSVHFTATTPAAKKYTVRVRDAR
jgi:uncharacterized protein YcfL